MTDLGDWYPAICDLAHTLISSAKAFLPASEPVSGVIIIIIIIIVIKGILWLL